MLLTHGADSGSTSARSPRARTAHHASRWSRSPSARSPHLKFGWPWVMAAAAVLKIGTGESVRVGPAGRGYYVDRAAQSGRGVSERTSARGAQIGNLPAHRVGGSVHCSNTKGGVGGWVWEVHTLHHVRCGCDHTAAARGVAGGGIHSAAAPACPPASHIQRGRRLAEPWQLDVPGTRACAAHNR